MKRGRRTGHARPEPDQLVRGLSEVASAFEDPRAVVDIAAQARRRIDVRAIRQALGLNQFEFAARFGISISTLRNWEQGAREPEGPARAYLTVIKNDPAAVLRALDRERGFIAAEGDPPARS